MNKDLLVVQQLLRTHSGVRLPPLVTSNYNLLNITAIVFLWFNYSSNYGRVQISVIN